MSNSGREGNPDKEVLESSHALISKPSPGFAKSVGLKVVLRKDNTREAHFIPDWGRTRVALTTTFGLVGSEIVEWE